MRFIEFIETILKMFVKSKPIIERTCVRAIQPDARPRSPQKPVGGHMRRKPGDPTGPKTVEVSPYVRGAQ